MRYSWLAAGLVLLGGASAAQAQLYFFGGGNGAYTYYYGPGYGYGYLPNAMPAGRPYRSVGGAVGGGAPQFTWYNPHTGYFSNQQTGLPWNYRSGVGPVSRNGSTGGGPGGVVRYSRTPTETNDPLLMARGGRIDVPSPEDAAKTLQAAKATEKAVADKAAADKTTATTTKPTVPKRVVRRPPVYSRPVNSGSGSADWVPMFSR